MASVFYTLLKDNAFLQADSSAKTREVIRSRIKHQK